MMLLSMTNSEILLKQIVTFKYMKELKVGERITLEVVEVKCISCQDCFFAKEGEACHEHCSASDRSDGKNIIFKEIKK